DAAWKFLGIVNALPAELRKGKNRVHLIHEVFQYTGFVFSKNKLKDAVDELSGGRLNTILSEDGEAITKEQFMAHLGYLAGALERFPSAARLELKLRAGVDELPDPAPVVPPEPLPGDLFEQLAEDPRTQGLVRLADRLIAVLHIPMHSQASGDLSYGGISDITNRGNYDRLLLSELAHDDLLLTARLVNNEALYYRREEPPDNPKRKRTLLLDITLKMWGIPRVFAIAAALACVRNSRHGEQVEAYALGGEGYTAVDLASKEGVIRALELLHHSLHCGRSLQAVLSDLPASDQHEYILITDARQLVYPAFHACLQTVKESLEFVITTSREGDLRFFGCNKGRMKLLNAAKLDLDELLFAPRPGATAIKKGINTPAFMDLSPPPLLFPKTRIKQSAERLFVIEGAGIVVVNEAQRVLLLTERGKGAQELLSFIEKGTYTFGSQGVGCLYILVNNRQRKFLKFYKLHLSSDHFAGFNLSDEVQFANQASFHGSALYIRADYASFLFDCHSCEVTEKKEYGGYNDKIGPVAAGTAKNALQVLNSYLPGGHVMHSIMYKVREVYVSNESALVIGNYTLELAWNDHNIRIRENRVKKAGFWYAKEIQSNIQLLPQRNIKFNIRAWSDGSTATIDSRGLLHLKSSDTTLPEITIVLVTGGHTTCWSSDGYAAGSSYFIPEKQLSVIAAQTFYDTYIRPFINRLKQT
ncbi:MAG: hypothetical protein ABW019_07165, partial [Chitinophagaceae bacterium]